MTQPPQRPGRASQPNRPHRPGRVGRIVRRTLAGLLALVLVALVGGYWYARPLLLTGTGYAAHNACAITFLTGRANPDTDLPPNPLVPHLSTNITKDGPDGQFASSSVRGLLAEQQAWFTPGVGCTVASSKPELGTITPVPVGKNPLTNAGTPTMDPAVEKLVARAFGDDLSPADKKALGTRAVVVLRDGQLVAERYGDGFDAKTPQLGWSLTKSVASLMAGRLAKEGKLSVTEDHLRPEWTDNRAKITIDDLMRMTSGLDWDETYDLGTTITRMLYLEPDMESYVAGLPATHEPGTFQEYSSGSTNVLCGLIQQRAGHEKDAPADFPRTLLFEPLGLSSAVMEADAAGNPVCSSYMWATPRDWAAVGQFALANGSWDGQQLLPEDWMAQTTTIVPVKETDDPGYAAGWRANTLPDGTLLHAELPKDAYLGQGHDGQRIIVVPSEKLVVVRMGFSPGVDDLRVNTFVHDLIAMPRGG